MTGGGGVKSPKPSGPAFGGRGVPGIGTGFGWRAPGSPRFGSEPGKLVPVGEHVQEREGVSAPKVINIGVVGQTATSDRSLHTLLYPMMMGFAGMAFRPQLWIKNAQSFLHNNQAPSGDIYEDERHRPQVLAMHSFGATSEAAGDWSYVRNPAASRARGGTGNGGVMFTPPHLEPEDYFGINSTEDVDAIETMSHVMVTPGVSFTLGTPTLAGGLTPTSVAISQKLADATNKGIIVEQLDSTSTAQTLFEARVDQGTDEIRLTAGGTNGFVLPYGVEADRPTTPVTGEIRMSSAVEVDQLEYYESDADDWVTVATTADILATFVALSDTPGTYGAQAGKLLRVNATPDAVEFVDGDTLYTPTAAVFEKDGSVAMTGVPDFGGHKLSNLGAGSLGTDAFTINQALASFVNRAGGAFAEMTGWLTVKADNIGVAYGASGLDAVTYWNGSNFVINAGVGEVQILGSVLMSDNEPVTFGTGGDSKVEYDGTDLVITPDLVGSGKLNVSGDVDVLTGHDYYHKGVQGHTEEIIFTDADSFTHTVTVSGGIITDWSVSEGG